jgi:hypothetical protein
VKKDGVGSRISPFSWMAEAAVQHDILRVILRVMTNETAYSRYPPPEVLCVTVEADAGIDNACDWLGAAEESRQITCYRLDIGSAQISLAFHEGNRADRT